MRNADVLVSIFSQRALMNFGCTLGGGGGVKIIETLQQVFLHDDHIWYERADLKDRMVTRPVSVSEK